MVAAALAAGVASAQSMGDAAQRERERREKLKAKGGTAAVVTGDDLKSNKGSLANDPKAPPAASAVPDAALERAPRATPEPDRRASEEEWRRRMALAREQVAKWRDYHAYWSAQHLAPNDYFVDADGRKLVGSAENLRKLVADAKANLDRAEAELLALEEQARRENVPPGWLR